MPAVSELVAHGRSEAEIEAFIGCDWLIYQELTDLIAAVQEGNPALQALRYLVLFSGEYVTGLGESYLEQLELMRSDDAKEKRRDVVVA
jgi:amidophosphoribosyltransferase